MSDTHSDDLSHQWYIADDIPLEIDTSFDTSVTTLVSKRKTKRMTPESDKDQKYWNKRKRNNVAAKRSRENKRKVEFAIRNKLLILEEDNAIMRKEISLLKSKLKLPESDCLLTEEEKEDCIRSAHNALQSTMGSKRLSSETSTEDDTRYSNGNNTFSPDCIGSYSEDRSDEQEYDTAHAPSDKLNDSVYIPCATHWAASNCTRNPPPAHTSQSVSANCEEMRSSCGYQHFHGNNSAQGHHDPYQMYPPYAQQPREVYPSPAAKHAHVPADLSMKQAKSSAPSSDLAVMRSENTWHSPPIHADIQNSTGNGALHNENEHLKTKLFQLAAQVEEMKNMIMKR